MNLKRLARNDERGMALITALMIMLLMSALMVSFTAIMTSDQRFRGIDKDRNRAYYGAQSGLEKLTVDFGNLFLTNVAPTNQQIANLANNPPVISGVTFTAQAPVVAYGVTPLQQLCGTPPVLQFNCSGTIQNGPYQGLIALKKVYGLDAVAKTTNGGEAHLTRKIESVAIPVFQFGTFSDVDLSLFAGANFTFTGRIHTNGNLFLSAQTGGATTLSDKVTAVGDMIRQRMQNGLTAAANGFNGTISAATAPNTFRAIQFTEGSLVDGVGSAPNANWHVISLSTYNGYLRNGGCPPVGGCAVPPRGTGAKTLQLPVVTVGGTNPDLVRRPVPGEDVNNAVLFGERLFGKVSLRILLSDTPADITGLPTVTAAAPLRLGDDLGAGFSQNWTTNPPAGYGPVDATHPPIALSPGVQSVTLTGNVAVNAATLPVAAPFGNQFPAAGPYPYNSPATLNFDMFTSAANMAANIVYQTIKCTSISPTASPNQFISCTRNAGNLLAVNVGYLIRGKDGTVVNSAATVSANQGAGAGPFNYTVQNSAPIAGNTFWMQDFGTLAWNLVYCLGVKNAAGVSGGAVDTWQSCTNVPAAKSNVNGGPGITTNQLVAQNVSPIGGYIKIEIQKNDKTWQDVTMEVLNWGIGAPNQDGQVCDDPSPNAILRLQRLRDNGGICTYSKDTVPVNNNLPVTNNPYDYWPQAIFDTREALLRQPSLAVPAPATTNIVLGGVMYYVAIDVGNLSKWFKAQAPYGASSGPQVLLDNGGYSVYFSDRRNNRADGTNGTCNNCETGEYGWEDVVNPLNVDGSSNGQLDAGEDVNANNLLDTYGKFPNFQGVRNALPPGAVGPTFNNAGAINPQQVMNRPQALTSRAYLFRRALKLINAGAGNVVTPGFTVVTENPVYIHGDWNWDAVADPLATAAHSETSVIADAVTLLSNAWVDANAFRNPYDATLRVRTTNSYRLAIIAGKPPAFPWPAAGAPDSTFGTDGGAHNFLRYLETGNAPLATNYLGSIATFYYSRQATGTYKFTQATPPNNAVYSAPNRNYNFDADFLDPAKLPPLTPMFRDINALGFTQEMRPGK
jgi:hypothetical protein